MHERRPLFPTYRTRAGARLRRAFLAGARRLTPYVAATGDEGVFLLSTREQGMGRKVFVSGRLPEFTALARAVSILREHGRDGSGSLFLDVGANIGTTTVPALRRHGFGRALCFEPEPENVPVLQANIALNRLADRVAVVEAAVSDTPGRALFARGPETPLGRRTGVGSLHAAKGGGPGVEVDVVSLDACLAERGVAARDVGLLWIDAQGAEGHVLAGATTVTGAGVPIVFALRARKLARAGGAELLLQALSEYGFSVDLRDPTARPLPASALADRVVDPRKTDLLVF